MRGRAPLTTADCHAEEPAAVTGLTRRCVRPAGTRRARTRTAGRARPARSRRPGQRTGDGAPGDVPGRAGLAIAEAARWPHGCERQRPTIDPADRRPRRFPRRASWRSPRASSAETTPRLKSTTTGVAVDLELDNRVACPAGRMEPRVRRRSVLERDDALLGGSRRSALPSSRNGSPVGLVVALVGVRSVLAVVTGLRESTSPSG